MTVLDSEMQAVEVDDQTFGYTGQSAWASMQ